jgi:hypothetical protein
MPTKRVPLARPSRQLPDAINRLLAGELIEDTPENRAALAEALLLAVPPGGFRLPEEAERRGYELLRTWDDAALSRPPANGRWNGLFA